MFPGLNAIDRALESRTLLLGFTAHFIDNGVDTGPIIMQSVIHRAAFRTYDDVLDLQIPMLIQIIDWLRNDRISTCSEEVGILQSCENPTFFPSLDTLQDFLIT